jgi:hypothetical protein
MFGYMLMNKETRRIYDARAAGLFSLAEYIDSP